MEKPDAEVAALLPRLGLLGPELLVVEHLQEPVERLGVVAAVVGHRHLGLERSRELRDEVLPPDLGGVHLEGGRRRVDHPLEHVAGLGPPGAPVRVHRGGVGEDARDLALDGADRVDAVQERAVEEGRDRGSEGREIGAEVGGGLDVQSQDLAVLGHRHRGVGHVISPVRVRQVRLAAGRRPADRPLELARRPGADDLLVVEEDLGAESAAHVGGDHAHLVLGDAEHEGAHQEPMDVRVLRGHPERQLARGVLVARDAGPRLHRVGDQALVHDALLDDDVRGS